MAGKNLIINADDLGWSRDAVDSVIALHNEGIVSSTSVMTTMPAFEYGVEKLKENPDLGAGVHLSLFDGKPVLPSEEVPSLVDRETGQFLSFDVLKTRTGSLDARQVAAEYEAQIQRFLAAGLTPTHLDVHTSLPYMIPRLYKVILELNARYGLPMRTLIGRDLKEKSRQLAARQKLPVFVVRFVGNKLLKGMARHGIRHPDYFIPEFSDADNEADVEGKRDMLEKILANLPDGVSELLTHPSLKDAHWRQVEHKALMEIRDLLKSRSSEIHLCDYRMLS